MRLSRLFPAVLLVAAGLTPASAAELASLGRTLPDEPKCKTATPGYCLLAFGQEARTLVWLVQDGDIMHVHASPDGKAPKTWRQVKRPYSAFALGDIWEDGGKTCHKNLCYYPSVYPIMTVHTNGKTQEAGQDRSGKLAFAPAAKNAPVIHFAGPLTLDLHYTQQPLRSGHDVDLSVVVGTPGVGPGTFAALHCFGYPKQAWPTAVLELPRKTGGDRVVVKLRLAEN